MNDDIYAEWLVKRKDKAWKYPAVAGLGLLCAFSVMILFLWSWGFIVTIAAIFGTVMAFKFMHVEYEYVFVTNELAIDKIYNQSIRRKGLRIQMDKVELVEKTSTDVRLQAEGGRKILDYSSQEKDAQTYSIFYSDGSGKSIILFEPNEKVLHAMWRCSPSKVKYQR